MGSQGSGQLFSHVPSPPTPPTLRPVHAPVSEHLDIRGAGTGLGSPSLRGTAESASAALKRAHSWLPAVPPCPPERIAQCCAQKTWAWSLLSTAWRGPGHGGPGGLAGSGCQWGWAWHTCLREGLGHPSAPPASTRLRWNSLEISIFLELSDGAEGHRLLLQADHAGRVWGIGEHPSCKQRHVAALHGEALPQGARGGQSEASGRTHHLPLR